MGAVLGVRARDGGEVGVAGDGPSVVAGLRLCERYGLALDAAPLLARVAADPTGPCGAELRITEHAPVGHPVLHRELHLLVRLDPVRSARALLARGGAASALPAVLDRAAASLAGLGIAARPLGQRQLRRVLDAERGGVTVVLAADLAGGRVLRLRPAGSRRRRRDPTLLTLPCLRPGGPLPPVPVRLPPSGLVLGEDRAGRTVGLPLLLPHRSTRAAVAAPVGVALLLAARLLARACRVTVVTDHPHRWAPLGLPPGSVVPSVRHWPPRADGPWALLTDRPEPPPPGFATAPWSTVVHVCPDAAAAGRWWGGADAVLATRDTVAAAVRAGAAPALNGHDLAVVDRHGVTVVRPRLDPGEYRLLVASRSGAP